MSGATSGAGRGSVGKTGAGAGATGATGAGSGLGATAGLTATVGAGGGGGVTQPAIVPSNRQDSITRIDNLMQSGGTNRSSLIFSGTYTPGCFIVNAVRSPSSICQQHGGHNCARLRRSNCARFQPHWLAVASMQAAEQSIHLDRAQRPRKQITLSLAAALLQKISTLSLGFDAFGDQTKFETTGQSDDGSGDR